MSVLHSAMAELESYNQIGRIQRQIHTINKVLIIPSLIYLNFPSVHGSLREGVCVCVCRVLVTSKQACRSATSAPGKERKEVIK